MSSLAQSPTVEALPEARPNSSPLVTVRLLKALCRFVETHGWIAFAAVSSLCGWVHLSTLASRHLDHDELYTFYIAQAPTLKQLLVLTRTIDLHPPLSYLLIRASFAIFGISSWSCRLPSALAFFLTTALVYWLVARIVSPIYGIVSILFLWSVPYTYMADEARPYSLLLCFSTLMLVSWYRAAEESGSGVTAHERRFALVGLAVGGFGLLLSHILGVLPYGAFFAAELVRSYYRRKLDWGLWSALLGPFVSVLTYLPLFRVQSTLLYTHDYRPTPMRIVNFYLGAIRFLTIPFVVVALLSVLWPLLRRSPLRAPLDSVARNPMTAALRPLWFLLFCFSLAPIGVGLIFARTGTAFFDRYGFVALIPIAVIPAVVLGFRIQRNQTAGVAVALLLSTVLWLNASGRYWLIEQLGTFAPPSAAKWVLNSLALPPILYVPVKPLVAPHMQKDFEAAGPVSNLDAVDPDLPLVANTGLTFLEVDQQGDAALTKRLYLLNDSQSAALIAHDTVFENYDRLTKVFPIRGHVEQYCSFISTHPRFLALGAYNHPQGWLLKKLDMDGAGLRIIGTYQGITEEAQLYEVTVLQADTGCHTPR
jgi:Dolichyl-phosphate-mannose-protein mannosyltransferase